MPKTNKICMYFDKDELESISSWIDSYFIMNESRERKKCYCENKDNYSSDGELISENCECNGCKNVDIDTEILSRSKSKILSRLSQ